MIVVLNILWLVRTSKHILFWIYLWQLKEYHIARFIDHFNTHSGKKFIFNKLMAAKFILAGLFLFDFFLDGEFLFYLLSFLFFLYSVELLFFLKAIFTQTLKAPRTTAKTLLLGIISFAVVILFLLFVAWRVDDIAKASLFLLAFDIFTPFIVSAIVLLIQPAAVLIRNRILNKAAGKIKAHNNLTVIAITGSYGKTSTKEFLATILSKKFKTQSTKNHQNSEIGIAKCVLNNLKPEHEIFVVEMGAYNKGGIKLLCEMVKPKIGVVAGVNEQHLALFGSLENLLSAEGGRELAASLPKSGLLVVNGDNKYCLDLYKREDFPISERKKIYSLNKDKVNSDIWTEDVAVMRDHVSFLTRNPKGELTHFKVDVLGRHSIQNLLGAILVAKELGMSFEEIAEASKGIRQEQGGMALKKGKLNIDIIDSSYSSNPDGVLADLDYLSVFKGKKTVIMPCLIELGEKSKEIHKEIGKKIGEICDFAVITTKDRFEDIKAGAIDSGMNEKNIVIYENPKDIYTAITLFCGQGDAVLLEGRVPEKLIDLLTV